MKLHIITVGLPKLNYAQSGWTEYWQRLEKIHQVRVSRIPDKHNDAPHILAAASTSYNVALASNGKQLSSPELAQFLVKRTLEAREVSFIVGGPTGLPEEVLLQADFKWSLSNLTFPHDLAMIILLEALYRASTINNGHPYHK